VCQIGRRHILFLISRAFAAMTSLFKRLYENYSLGYYNKVVSIAEAEIKNCLASSDASKIQAASYFKLGNFQKCYDILVELETIYDSEPDYLSLYAASCRRLGLLDKSLQLFQLALSIEPNSIPIKNNYANLLIDIGQLDKAQSLLEAVLTEAPGYADAIKNKNRLEFLQQDQSIQDNNNDPTAGSLNLVDLGDPVLLAFADDEIERSVQRYKFKRASLKSKVELPSPDPAKSAQDFIKMAYQASISGDHEFALKLCSQSLLQIGPQAVLYECASDLYLNLKKFRESELCLLHAVSLDGPSPKRLLNLCNFASMRGDIKLAYKYLEDAASLDPSHPQLKSISKSLSNKSQDIPFKFPISFSYPDFK